jgi:Transglycosylase SLT domain
MIAGIFLAVPLFCGFATTCERGTQRSSRRASDERSAVAVLAMPPFQATPGGRPGSDHDSLPGLSSGTLSGGCPGNRGMSTHDVRLCRDQEADVEILRIEENLKRIRRDPAARERFYDEITHLIKRVRNNQTISQTSALGVGTAPSVISASSGPTLSRPSSSHVSLTQPLDNWLGFLSLPQPEQIMARFGRNARGLEDPQGSQLDARAVSRLLYWARQNGCPPQLALATAWQESGMSLRPPDGSSGEIGIMQILPARARSEGIDPRCLRNPDVDMWLGTKLLARYYRQEGSIARASMEYVGGPRVFDHRYPATVRDYIRWYSSSVQNYADYFAHYVNF